MTLVFAAVAVSLVILGALASAIDAAYGSVSRAEVVTIGDGTSRAKTFDAIATDIAAHLNAINFVRVVSETFSAILVALVFVSLGVDVVGSLVGAALVMTVLTFVLVGSSPRLFGRAHPIAVVTRTGRFVRACRIVVGPVTSVLVGIGSVITPGRVRTTINTERQLMSMVDEATESDAIEEEDRDLIRSIFDFGDTIVREVMVARTDMVTLNTADSVDTAVGVFLSEGYSRMPVIGEGSDDIVGIAYLKDVIRFARFHPDEEHSKPIGQLARPALFVPEVKKADEALRELQERSNHMALVVDEYGGIAGLVTLEDLIEEVIGEISDEYDDVDESDFVAVGNGAVRAAASASIDSLAEYLDIAFDEDDVDTVGGLFVKHLGRLPAVGDSVEVHGLRFVAERVERRRKKLVSVLVTVEEIRDDA